MVSNEDVIRAYDKYIKQLEKSNRNWRRKVQRLRKMLSEERAKINGSI